MDGRFRFVLSGKLAVVAGVVECAVVSRRRRREGK